MARVNAYYVYAVVAGGYRLPAAAAGFDDSSLALVPWRGIAAVVSMVDRAPSPTRDHLLRHASLVDRLCRLGAAIPVRFGTVLPDLAGVQRTLDARYAALLQDLRRLGGRIELGVTVLWETETAAPLETAPSLSPIGPGSRYLAARLAAHRLESHQRSEAAALASVLDGLLAPHALESRTSVLATSRLPFRGAYLLEPNALGPFREAFGRACASNPALRFLLSGPWPPYSFVTPPGHPSPVRHDPGDALAAAAIQSPAEIVGLRAREGTTWSNN